MSLREQIIEELTTPGPSDQYSSTALLVANRARREWEAVALKWNDENRELKKKLKELECTLELIRKADARATRRWREAAPGRELVIPDRTEMVLWLLSKLDGNPEPLTTSTSATL